MKIYGIVAFSNGQTSQGVTTCMLLPVATPDEMVGQDCAHLLLEAAAQEINASAVDLSKRYGCDQMELKGVFFDDSEPVAATSET